MDVLKLEQRVEMLSAASKPLSVFTDGRAWFVLYLGAGCALPADMFQLMRSSGSVSRFVRDWEGKWHLRMFDWPDHALDFARGYLTELSKT